MIDIKKDKQVWSISFLQEKRIDNKNLKRKKIYARLENNSWSADLLEIGSLSLKIEVLNIDYLWQLFSPNMLESK